MALKIRLRRMGRKKAPTYRIVVAESTMPRDGRFVATLGHYNPRTQPMTLVVDRDKALSWLAQGAVPTDTAESLLKKAGVYEPQSAVDTAVEAVKSTAGQVVEAAKDAATAVTEQVAEVTGALEQETAAEAPESVAEVERQE